MIRKELRCSQESISNPTCQRVCTSLSICMRLMGQGYQWSTKNMVEILNGRQTLIKLTISYSRNSIRSKGLIYWYQKKTYIEWSRKGIMSMMYKSGFKRMLGRRTKRSELWRQCKKRKSWKDAPSHLRSILRRKTFKERRGILTSSCKTSRST